MVTGWFQIDGAWYYFNPNSDGTRGAMQVSKWIGNDYVGANGKFEKSR
jgi:glucan-binding YG repeat protein